MLGRRWQLAYETPVFGAPWSMPFELPVYEWLVAGLVSLTGWPLDQTGRAVSQAFFLLCLWPCWVLLARLGVEPRLRLVALGLLLLSPFYLFWSRAFLIESTALFLALSYLAAGWTFLERPSLGLFVLGVTLGALAAAVKITTCAAAWLGLGLLLVQFMKSAGWRWRGPAWLALVCVPLIAGLLWTHFADGLKEQNPFAHHLTSRALIGWNFGTWAQRKDPAVWGCTFFMNGVVVRQNAFAVGSLLVCLLARRRRLAVGGCLAIYLALPLVFLNLYLIHEYYYCASMVFLVGAVALAVTGLAERRGRAAWAGALLAAAFVLTACYDYVSEYYPRQSSNHVESEALCRAVQEWTQPNEVLVVLGCDWNSEVPCYSRRRALMIPFWGPAALADLPRDLEFRGDYPLGGLVIRRRFVSGQKLADVLRELGDCGLVASLIFQDDVYSLYVLSSGDDLDS
jgi:hypothetical protein